MDNLTLFDTLLPHHLCAPLIMETGVMGHMGNVACPILDLHSGRVVRHMSDWAHEQWSTWAMGHISIRGRVMGYMGDGKRGDGTHYHNDA